MMLSCFFGLHVYLPQNSPSPTFDSLDEKLYTGPRKVMHWSSKSYTLVLEKLCTGPRKVMHWSSLRFMSPQGCHYNWGGISRFEG